MSYMSRGQRHALSLAAVRVAMAEDDYASAIEKMKDAVRPVYRAKRVRHFYRRLCRAIASMRQQIADIPECKHDAAAVVHNAVHAHCGPVEAALVMDFVNGEDPRPPENV